MLEFPEIVLKLNNNLECLGLKKPNKMKKPKKKTPPKPKKTQTKQKIKCCF